MLYLIIKRGYFKLRKAQHMKLEINKILIKFKKMKSLKKYVKIDDLCRLFPEVDSKAQNIEHIYLIIVQLPCKVHHSLTWFLQAFTLK